jgi:membrane associated rhomboid family serine protease
MIPLRDANPVRSTPVVTIGIVALNALIFLRSMADPEGFARDFGAVAYHYSGSDPAIVTDGVHTIPPVPDDGRKVFRALSHMWLHAGFMHFAGNMWFLWVFGDNVEDRLGRLRYAILYFLSGFVALLAQILADPSFSMPMIGASGAVSGVLGAYLVMFPKAEVLTLIPLGYIFTTMVWPAFVFLLIWFGFQLVQGALLDAGGGGVAWWAHAGGFVVGAALGRPLMRRDRDSSLLERARRFSGR